jgi:mevalonate kinase
MRSVASAPGKVILFGEHFVVYGIKAILCSIDKRITATSQFLDEKVIRVSSSLGEAKMDLSSLNNLEKIPQNFMKPFFYIVKETIDENASERGIEIIIESEIPAGIGLGSSSAACVAVTASVNGLFNRLSKKDVVKKAIQAERTIFEQNSGADASVSTFGGLVSYDLKNDFQHIPSRNNLDFIISNSAQIHNTQDIVKQVREFKERKKEIFMKLCKQEIEIVKKAMTSLKDNNLNELGSLMLKNQELLKQIGISTEKIDLLVREAKKTAYGAKITGAGGGGCIISLVDNSNMRETLDNLRKISDCFLAKIDYNGLTYSR